MRISTFRKLRKTAVLSAAALATAASAGATTYTAISSGAYSSASTWLGGSVPSATNTGDQIIINSGVTVTMDQSLYFNGPGASLVLNGTLNYSNNASLVLSNALLSGAGSMNMDSLALSTTASLLYTGTITTQRMSTTGFTMASAATINVVQRLRALGGIVAVNAGSLNLSSGATIVMSGGVFNATSGGLLGLTNSYNLRYEGSANVSTGLEASGSGLHKVEIATAASSGLSLSSDLTVRDTLTLTSGYLRLAGRNLSFAGGGNFSAYGSGSIVASSASSLSLTGSASFLGGLRFRSDSNTVGNLTVNSSGSSATTYRLGSSLFVNGVLSLQNGRLDIDSNLLALTASGSLSGGSSSSYVVTGRGGRLGLYLSGSTSVAYQIGTRTYYAPASLSGNSGNTSGLFSIGVEDSVRAAGTTGTATSATRKMVNATWHVTSASSSNVNINLTTMWSSSMEVNGFNRSQAYISHYTSGSWDATASASASATANGMYSLSRSGITSLSPFAVVDRDYALKASALTAGSGLRIYPNPASGDLHISGSKGGALRADIYNAAGLLVKSAAATGNTVSVAELSAGIYQLRLSGSEEAAVLRFVKQ